MTKYGIGIKADNICIYCRRGGARQIVAGGRAHKKCIPVSYVGKYPCQNRNDCKYPHCDCGKSGKSGKNGGEMRITDPEEIVECFNSSMDAHFTARMPDGSEDDNNLAIPEFLAKQEYGNTLEVVDQNGSETESAEVVDGKAKFKMLVMDREFLVDGKTVKFAEMELLCTIREIASVEEEIVVIEEVKMLSTKDKHEWEEV